MAVSDANFSATVDAWVRKSQNRLTAIFKESTQRVVSLAQFRIPVDTGFARASIRASLEAMPQIDPAAAPNLNDSLSKVRYPYDPGEIVLSIVGAQLGQTVYIGWTANYVINLEYGSSKKAPSGFVRLAALEWQRIIDEVVAEAKARVG